MWVYILMLLVGLIGLVTGIVQAGRSQHKKWHILTAVGAMLTAAGIAMTAATLLLLGGIASDPPAELQGSEQTSGEVEPWELDPGEFTHEDDFVRGDWRTWRGYSQDYSITGELAVCLSALDDGTGYGVYNAAGGERIANLVKPDGAEGFFEEEVLSEDHNSDGTNDLGISLSDGTTLWYCFDETQLGTWPDNIEGCFARQD